MSFAAIEASISAGCVAAFENATATLPDFSALPGVLQAAATPGGVYGVAPGYLRSFTAQATLVADLEVEDVITIAETDYEVVAIEPDGMGLTVLGLR
jgi:hypothetical protein